MIHYNQVMTIINITNLVKVIIEVIVRYNSLSESIMRIHNTLFTLKFMLSYTTC